VTLVLERPREKPALSPRQACFPGRARSTVKLDPPSPNPVPRRARRL